MAIPKMHIEGRRILAAELYEEGGFTWKYIEQQTELGFYVICEVLRDEGIELRRKDAAPLIVRLYKMGCKWEDITELTGSNPQIIMGTLHRAGIKTRENKRIGVMRLECNKRHKRLEKAKVARKEARKEALKKYYQTEKGKKVRRKRNKKSRQTEKGRINSAKCNAKRRGLGHIHLNKPFPGCNGHHIDKDHIIHIPKEPHNRVYHNVWTGQGMEEINAIAFEFLESTNNSRHIA